MIKNQDAKRILSIGVGILLLFHGIHKAIYGIDYITIILENYHIAFAKYIPYSIFLSEIIAPLFLIYGKYTNFSATIISIDMLIRIVIIHLDNLLELSEHGAWIIEVPMLYLIASITLILWNEESCLK